jgi:hypothetical protein
MRGVAAIAMAKSRRFIYDPFVIAVEAQGRAVASTFSALAGIPGLYLH